MPKGSTPSRNVSVAARADPNDRPNPASAAAPAASIPRRDSIGVTSRCSGGPADPPFS
ncbi:hypothetical protein JCM2811A_08430 [Methylorubrum rhodinum]